MDRTVLITGAGSGIGYATAIEFAKAGDNVIVTYNSNIKGANRVVKKCAEMGTKEVKVVRLDFTNVVSINRAMKEIEKILGENELDVFISNAGVLENAPIGTLQYHKLVQMNQINFIGPCDLTRRLLPFKPKTMIYVGSDLAFVPKQDFGDYGCTKAALRMYVQVLVREGHNAYCVNPDPTRTPMIGDIGRNARDVANVIYRTALDGYRKPPGADINVWEIFAKPLVSAAV